MSCASCGAPLEPGDRFCGVCGTVVAAGQTTSSRPRWLVPAAIAVAVVLLTGAIVVGAVVASRPAPSVVPPVETPVAESPAETSSPTPTPSPTESAEVDFAGQWTGDILGDAHPYTVQVSIVETGGVISGTAVYPEIPCEGTWAQSSRVGNTAIVIERMPSTNVCYDNVSITLVLADDGTMSYAAQSGQYFITATLTRTG